MKLNTFIYLQSNNVIYIISIIGDRMTTQDTINLQTKTITGLILTAVVIILLVFDGIIPHLPIYDLKAQNSFPIHLYFVIQVLTCVICQILYLKIIRTGYVVSSSVGSFRSSNITYLSVSAIQYTIIAFLIFIVLQTEILNEYNSIVVSTSILLSIFLSVSLTGMLAFRFVIWLRHGRDMIIFSYAISMILITLSSLFLAVSILSEIGNNQSVIDSSRISASTQNIANFSFKELQEYFSAISFVSLWLASVLLLSQTRKKWRTIKFWLLVTVPLAYYFGAFQLIVSYIINQYDILNQIQNYTLDLINSILTRPIGGILFGIAFWTIARNIGNENIKYFMMLSAFGIMLLSISNVDTGIFMLPYPPFGLVTLSFLGISSYLLLVGIYSSAISVSLDHKIRSSVQNSVEHELRFVSKIGTSQMEQDIQQRVKHLTRKVADNMEIESGVIVPMEDEEVDRYIKARN